MFGIFMKIVFWSMASLINGPYILMKKDEKIDIFIGIWDTFEEEAFSCKNV